MSFDNKITALIDGSDRFSALVAPSSCRYGSIRRMRLQAGRGSAWFFLGEENAMVQKAKHFQEVGDFPWNPRYLDCLSRRFLVVPIRTS
jgi:hypothetical protein